MGDAGIALSGWRLRAGAFAAGAIVVALTCVLLVAVSRTTMFSDDSGARRLPAWIVGEFDPPPPPRTAPRAQRPTGAPAPIVAAPAQASNDPAVLAQALRCFGARRGERPRNCPSEQGAQDWTGRGDLPVGGDFYRPPDVDLERIFTRAELALREPPCSGVCVPIGPKPPPPTRSAEQVCEDGGLGGPCRPPEPDRVIPEN